MSIREINSIAYYGTQAGGIKVREKNLAKDPNWYKVIGKIGGMNGTGHSFGHGKVDPRVAGARGGRKSKRTKKQDKAK